MKKLILLSYLFLVTSCMQQINANMERSNVLMQENLEAMQRSQAAIEENTRQIENSIEAMHQFEFVLPVVIGIVLLIVVFLVIKNFRKIVRYFKKG